MKMVKTPMRPLLAAAAAGLLALAGCGSTPTTQAEKANLTDDGQSQVKALERDFPDLRQTVDASYGYAVFPSIAKGGLVFEAASGQGVVYEQGKLIGYSHLTLVNFGAVAGGEDYTELLVFQTKAAMADFEANKLSFNANAEAVALKAGARAYPKFVNGVAIFIKANSGFAVDASIGGQQFTFTREADATPANPMSPNAPPQ